MMKAKMEIKKIDNIGARQVTFSKRKKGLFKKAQELSTLCDAEIALTVFSSAGKLFEYATSSVQQVVERYNMHPSIDRLQHPSTELQPDSDTYNYFMMSKDVADRTCELRKLNGEELQGLKPHELQKLEKLLKKGLARVSKAKDEIIVKDITALKKKKVELVQDNRRLKQKQSLANDPGQSSKLIMICSPSNLAEDSDNFDASLCLGYVEQISG
ncbi:hypothetical protein SESBI_32456 [Sesbania bispinosa]|nr:hypothetical protein SESBI_32456 [Sesbania bispinosa]